MNTKKTVLTALVAAATLGSLAAPASASCMFDDRPVEQQVAEADIVFVGTVVGTADQERSARFQVEEVWKGPDLVDPTVHGGPGEPGMATSVDRSWQQGSRYLVVPTTDGARLTDNSCTPTRVWTDDLAAARPADARVVEASGADDADVTGTATASPVPWIIVGAVAAAVVGGGAWALVRRRSAL